MAADSASSNASASSATAPAAPRRRPLRWILLTVVLLALVVRAMIPDTLGEQARRSIEAKLAAYYPHLDIRIARGRYAPGQGLILEDIVVAAPLADGTTTPILTVARLVAETDIDWELASNGRFPMTAQRMIVSGLEANVWSDPQGKFSFETLLPFPKWGPGCPLILVQDARVRLMSDPAEPTHAMEWTHVEARISASPDSLGEAGTHRVQGTATSSNCQRLTFEALGGKRGWTVRGAAQELRLDHSRLARLPKRLAVDHEALRGLNGIGDALFMLSLQPGQAPQWQVQADIREGRFDHPHLPLNAKQISGRVVASDRGATFENIQARVDGALCRLNGTARGLSWPCDVQLNLEATDLLLDQRLAAALPAEMRQQWDRLQPSGHIDVAATFTHQADQWSVAATVQSKGVAVRFDRFPYPVRDLNGTIQFNNGFIRCDDLYGTADGQPMRCQLRCSPPGSGQEDWFRATVDGTIAIDDTLLNALTPRNQLKSKLETFVRSLSPAGGMRVAKAEIRIDPDGNKTQNIDLRFENAQLHYDGFPYPLYGIDGQVIVQDDTTRLVNFVAANGDTASVRCDGTYRVGATGGALDLQFVGLDVPLDRALRAALPAESRRTWDALSPSGILDRIEVSLAKTPEHNAPDLKIAASLLSAEGVSQNTVSVRPIALPYRMDIVSGKVVYADGTVRIEQLDGRHDGSRLAATGTCEESKDGRWQLDLNVLSGSRLTVDSELVSTMPLEVQGVCQRLQLRGPLGLHGKTSLLLPSDEIPLPETRFDLSIQLEGNRIGDVGPVRDIRGELILRGQQDVHGVTADGTVQLDSLHFQDLQLTGIHGPFSIRGDQLSVGALNAALEPGQDFQPVAGSAFGGQFTLAGTVGLSTSQYDMFVSLADANVPTVLADFQQAQSDMTGQLSGEVRLEGALGAMHLLKGTGQASLSGANLYQMPQIVQLLTQLRITPGEDVAFTDGKAKFTLSGDQIAFSQLQLWGDLVALHGTGTISHRRDLELSFNTRVSPQNTWSRLIHPLSNQPYTLWTINVSGPIDSPSIERRALDGVSETLERLFPGML